MDEESHTGSYRSGILTTVRMTVDKYFPEGLYGFVTNGDRRLFFHLKDFDPGPYTGESPVPPVSGEDVDVEAAYSSDSADSVQRVEDPLEFRGSVDWFDAAKGYGFILGADGLAYYLHRSEVLDGRLPLPGLGVRFYTSSKRRACFVQVEKRARR
jgi:cold shock CspA family protein